MTDVEELYIMGTDVIQRCVHLSFVFSEKFGSQVNAKHRQKLERTDFNSIISDEEVLFTY